MSYLREHSELLWIVYLLGLSVMFALQLLFPPKSFRSYTPGSRGAAIIFTAVIWPLEVVIQLVRGAFRAIGTLTEGL